MARLGIDYGTTNTVAVCNDRGHYPVVQHLAETSIGAVVREVFPSLLAWDRETARLLFGPEAERCLLRPEAGERYAVLRSLKRRIRDYVEGAKSLPEIGPDGADPADVLRLFLQALRESMMRSGGLSEEEPLEAVITWPANANGAQRHLTRRCFREAGFRVAGALAEPVAAAIEFADRVARGNRAEARRVAMTVAVFDLGGGTLDVSLVRVDGPEFTVVDAAGVEHLGGDDLDELLARRFAREMGLDFDALPAFRRTLLLAHACRQKESLSTGAVRRLDAAPEAMGLRGPGVSVPAAEYFEEAGRLLSPAVETLRSLLHGRRAREAGIPEGHADALYLVGGACKFPAVPAMLAKAFPRSRRIMTDKPFTATAMGAAIHSAENVRLHDILARTFGVMRLAEGGTREVFTPVFPAGTRLPAPGDGPLVRAVEYAPHHNIGHLRYLECVSLDHAGRPAEGVRFWSDALFPYDPQIPPGSELTPGQIVPRSDLERLRVRETYACDADGVISVRIVRLDDGLSRSYEIFRS